MGREWDFSGLRALFINCTLKRSPETWNTQGLVDASAAIMARHGIAVDARGSSSATSRPASGRT
jgi:hypothetical protein